MQKKLIPFVLILALAFLPRLFAQEEQTQKGEELLKALEETKQEAKANQESPAEENAAPAESKPKEEAASEKPENKGQAELKKKEKAPVKETVAEKKTEASPEGKALLLAPAIYGQTGLFRVYSAQRMPASLTTLSAGFHGEWFTQENLITPGDEISRVVGSASLTYIPVNFMEIYASMFGFSNTGKANATLLQRMGDIRTGIKVAVDLNRWLSAGTNFQAEILNGAGDANVTSNAYSYDLRALITMDFLKSAEVPIRLHFNAGYRWDGTMNASGAASLNANQRFFLNVIPANQITFGIGFEVPVEFVSLFAEYSSEQIWSSSYGNSPQRVTTGIRLFPTQDQNVTLDAGLDIRMMNSDRTTRVIAVPKYNIIFGLTFTNFPHEAAPKIVKADGSTGRLSGSVIDSETQNPVEGAIISFDNGLYNAILSKPGTGEYTTCGLPQGLQKITVSKEGYEPLAADPEIVAGQTTQYDFALSRRKVEKGSITFMIYNVDDKPLLGKVTFLDYPNLKPYLVDTDRGGLKVKLKEGEYKVRISADKFSSEEKIVKAGGGQDLVDKTRLRDIVEKVTIKKNKIVIKQMVHFATNKADILPDSFNILNNVADLISDHPEIKKVKIEGHTDSVGEAAYNLGLSQKRAEAVMDYLVVRGVEKDRLEAVGYGEAMPIASNKTKNGRATNRRVEFTIVSE